MKISEQPRKRLVREVIKGSIKSSTENYSLTIIQIKQFSKYSVRNTLVSKTERIVILLTQLHNTSDYLFPYAKEFDKVQHKELLQLLGKLDLFSKDI